MQLTAVRNGVFPRLLIACERGRAIIAIILAGHGFKSLVLNAALAALPVATYAAADFALRAVSAVTECSISDASEARGSETEHTAPGGGDPDPRLPTSTPEALSIYHGWLKAEAFELSLRISRMARPSRLASGAGDGLLPPPPRAPLPRAFRGCFDCYGPACVESTRLVRLAPALLAHAPPPAA